MSRTPSRRARARALTSSSGRRSRASGSASQPPLPACRDVPSTGLGIPSVAVARERVLWISYTGGNKREWQLWTATATRRQPRQLRAVERDVEAPAPIVLGPGTVEGVPYAVDSEVVLLGENGRAIFRPTVASPVRAIAAGVGPGGIRVAALLVNGVRRRARSAGACGLRRSTPVRAPPRSASLH